MIRAADWESDVPESDLVGNGNVDGSDLSYLLSRWAPATES